MCESQERYQEDEVLDPELVGKIIGLQSNKNKTILEVLKAKGINLGKNDAALLALNLRKKTFYEKVSTNNFSRICPNINHQRAN